jgi:hypothetical protein
MGPRRRCLALEFVRNVDVEISFGVLAVVTGRGWGTGTRHLDQTG